MFRLNRTSIVLLLFAVIGSTNVYSKIRTNAQSLDEQRIIEIILQVQRGIQNQRLYQILDYYVGETDKPVEHYTSRREKIEEAFAGLFDAYKMRVFPSPFGEMSNTRDFKIKIKQIEISGDKNEAWADVEAGFAVAPVDSTLLDNLSQVQKRSMSDLDKLNLMRYKPLRVHFVKVNYNWNISSFGNLEQVVNANGNFFSNYQAAGIDRGKTKK